MKAATLRIPRSALALLLITVLLLLASTAWAGPRIKRASPPPQPAAEDDASTAEPEPFLPEVLVSEASFDPTGLELGMRFGSTSAFDDWVDSDGTADYGGLGFIFRWRFDPDWAVGLAVDFFARSEESGRLDETRVITDLFVSYFLSSPDWFQLYLPFGLLASNNVMNTDGWDSGEYTEVGPYTGVGIDFYVDSWRFNAELRGSWLLRTEGEDYTFEPLRSDYIRTAPDSRAAVQILFGVLFSL